MNIQNVKLIGILVLQAGLLSHAFSASVSDPVLSVAGLSTSQQTVAVTISDTTSGATICYTTDGSNPSQSSATITSGGTILIPQNATLNVQAFLSGTSTSNMVTAQYGINAIVSAGDAHTLALRNDGTVWAWGDNSCGELGNGTIINSGTAVQVMINSGTALSGVVAIAAGSYESFAVDGNGNVWAWGLNTNGELAIGTTTNAVFATQIVGLSGIVGIASSGYHTLALENDETVWGWGAGNYGQVGNGSGSSWETQPVQVAGAAAQGTWGGVLEDIVAVVAGETHSLALDNGGSVWGWGNNISGQLGSSPLLIQQSNTPMPSASSLNGAVVAVSAASDNSTALEKNGTLWTWGSGYPGNGNGLFLSTSPIQASFSGSMVAMTSQASLDTSGTVWAWGDNMYDQLGVGEAGSYATLPLIVNLSTATAPMLSITSGSSQSVMDGSFSTPLTITATSGGNPVANTLVIVQNSSGLIVSSTNAPVYSGILQVQTNGSGQASVYYQEPANGQGTSEILATSGNQQSPFFMMLSANGGVPLMSRWMMVALVLLLFALGVYSLLKKRVSVSA